MTTLSSKKVFFGCPFDCDEKHEAIQAKLTGRWKPEAIDDPLKPIMDIIRQEIPADLWRELPGIEVPDWLRPMPPRSNQPKMVVDEFINFIDQDGCRDMAAQTDRFVTEHILPQTPVMVTVDHSLSGGVLKALTRCYGTENITVVVLDSHTDAMPMSVLADSIQYDIDNNPNSVYNRHDPFLYHRTDSYNASSFIHHLLDEKIILAKNLYIVGVSDYPEKRTLRIKDPRISRYAGVYTGLRRQGAKVITKKECQLSFSKLKFILQRIDTPYLYVSIDMDIGARNAVEGVRFLNQRGLNEKKIYRIADALVHVLSNGVQLAGLDINEINPRSAGLEHPSGNDRTYRIAANMIKKIAFLK